MAYFIFICVDSADGPLASTISHWQHPPHTLYEHLDKVARNGIRSRTEKADSRELCDQRVAGQASDKVKINIVVMRICSSQQEY